MPVFAAGELPIDGVDHIALADGVRERGTSAVAALHSSEAVVDALRGIVKSGDLVIGCGAGVITTWMHDLPELLAGPGEDAPINSVPSQDMQRGIETAMAVMKSAGGAA